MTRRSTAPLNGSSRRASIAANARSTPGVRSEREILDVVQRFAAPTLDHCGGPEVIAPDGLRQIDPDSQDACVHVHRVLLDHRPRAALVEQSWFVGRFAERVEA